ncbi:MAG: signal recognition particle-docking protein FtsY [Clostridiales bacterium]|nr:signal recognition particle-docking protein FtsY [Clostridiales bacterium]
MERISVLNAATISNSEFPLSARRQKNKKAKKIMGIFGKLFGALKKTKDGLSDKLRLLFSKNKLGDEFYEELEELLIASDVSYATAQEVVARVKKQAMDERLRDEAYVTDLLRGVLTDILEESEVEPPSYPCVIMLVGVNGVGKTTTVGKLAHYFLSQGKTVTVAAADTFRAAASEQLSIWADRAKVRIVKHEEGSDPSAVIFDAVSSAKAKKTDVVIVDTAGRLHVKDNLMNELRKMDRVVSREYPEADFLKLLVLDATTGQNAVNQARVFDEAIELDGLVLTKLDGTAKGGFVFSLASELSLPVVFAGVGEKMEDLEYFDSRTFVEAIL